MNENTILVDLKEQFLSEREDIQKLLNQNLIKIQEIENYLDSIYNNEDSNFRIFSPRSAENLYKENIDNKLSEKHSMEIRNRDYYKRINQLDKYLYAMDKLDLKNTEEKNTCSIILSETDKYDVEKNLKILDIQEKERQRIARDLHDSSLQNLAHLVHKIELSSMFIDQDPLRAKLELATVNKNLKAIIDDIRNNIFNMRPMTFDDLGLKDCFERLFMNLKKSHPNFDFVSDIQEIKSKNDLVLMTIYRVVQECCMNAIKHSNGNKIFVSLNMIDSDCIITIKDNGIGFNVFEALEKNERHYGLSIMSERIQLINGKIEFDSDENGTQISIAIPISIIEG